MTPLPTMLLLALIPLATMSAGSPAFPRACARGISEGDAEYEVKAAHLLNFTRFVEWPAGAFESDSAEIVIGIMGPGPLDRQVELRMEERTINGRPVRVVWLRDPEAVWMCHVAFVPCSSANTDRILSAAAGKPILTAGESHSFAARGGMIQLYVENQEVRFEINQAAVEQSGLRLSSRLLTLARLTRSATDGTTGAPPARSFARSSDARREARSSGGRR
jgi:hypothetical protein